MLHQKLARFFSSDIGIDLGTANCLVYVRDRGVVLSEPSVVAVNKTTRGVLAVGLDAKKMLGRTPVNIEAIRPMKDGVIADINITRHMLRYFIEKAKKYVSPRRRLAKPRIVIAVPTGITEVETSAVQDTATHAGASEVILLEEPMAAAIGIGLPVGEPVGSMIVDIGGGTTEVAIISLAGIVDSRSVRVGGDEMDLAIISNMKRAYQLMIGERTAENIKITIGNVYPDENGETEMEVKGRDLVSGLPKVIKISSREVRSWLLEPVTSIVEAVRTT
ncbi:MAG: rod shape-determining protein, partial [Lentisphaeria bacterium]|nr:rod shape-determining protein [Lentisphaeria bacterium]